MLLRDSEIIRLWQEGIFSHPLRLGDTFTALIRVLLLNRPVSSWQVVANLYDGLIA